MSENISPKKEQYPSWEKIYPTLLECYKQPDLAQFLRGSQAGLTADELLDFLKQDFTKNYLEIKWRYETDPQWEYRTTNTAIEEAILNGLNDLSFLAEMRLDTSGSEEDTFFGMSDEEVRQVRRKSLLLIKYAQSKNFRSEIDKSSPQ